MKTINKTLVATICSLSVITCINSAPSDNQLTEKEKKEGWQLLFDGKSMNGWRRIYTDSPPKRGWHPNLGLPLRLPFSQSLRAVRPLRLYVRIFFITHSVPDP